MWQSVSLEVGEASGGGVTVTVTARMPDAVSAERAVILVTEIELNHLLDAVNLPYALITSAAGVYHRKALDIFLMFSLLFSDLMLPDFPIDLQFGFRQKLAIYLGLSFSMWQNVVLNVAEAAGGGVSITVTISMPDLELADSAVLLINDASVIFIFELLGLSSESVIITAEPCVKQSKPPDIAVRFTIEIVTMTLDGFSNDFSNVLRQKLAVASGLSLSMWQSVSFEVSKANVGVVIDVAITMPDLLSAEFALVSLSEVRVTGVLESVGLPLATITVEPGIDQSLPLEISVVFIVKLPKTKGSLKYITPEIQNSLRKKLAIASGLRTTMWQSVTLDFGQAYGESTITVAIGMPDLVSAEYVLMSLTETSINNACLIALLTSVTVTTDPYIEQKQPPGMFVVFALEISELDKESFARKQVVLRRKFAVVAGLSANMWQNVILEMSTPAGGRITITVTIEISDKILAEHAVTAVTETSDSNLLEYVGLPSAIITAVPILDKLLHQEISVVLSIDFSNLTFTTFTKEIKVSLRKKVAIASGLGFSRWVFVRLDQMQSVDLSGTHLLINITLPCSSASEAKLVISRLEKSETQFLFYPLSYGLVSGLNLVSSGKESEHSTEPPSILDFYPNKAFSKQEVFIAVELKNAGEDLLQTLEVLAQIDGAPVNISIYSFDSLDDERTLLGLKIRLTDVVGKAQIFLWTLDSNMSPISFYFESLPLETIIGNFEPRSGLIFGGNIVNIQIYNLPSNVSCPNMIFYFTSPSQADCLAFQYHVSSRSAKVSIRLPPASQAGAVTPALVLLPDKTRQYAFPQTFAYLDPPTILVDLLNPSVASISNPTTLWIRILNFPLYHSSSDIILLLKPKDENPIPMLLLGAVISSPNAISAYVQDLQFTMLTPIMNRPGFVDLEIYHRNFSQIKAIGQIRFVDQAVPQVKRLTLLETGYFSLDGLPLPVGSSTEKRVSISLSNIPFNATGQNWSVQGQFVRGLDYTFLSESSGTGTAVVKVNNVGGSKTIQYGLLSFGRLPSSLCNSSCCLDLTCEQATICGNDISVVCFSLAFFDDLAVEVASVSPSAG
jgi:hypothetical protein